MNEKANGKEEAAYETIHEKKLPACPISSFVQLENDGESNNCNAQANDRIEPVEIDVCWRQTNKFVAAFGKMLQSSGTAAAAANILAIERKREN